MKYRMEVTFDRAWILSQDAGKRPVEAFLQAFAAAAGISYLQCEHSLCDGTAVFESDADADTLRAKAEKCLGNAAATCSITPDAQTKPHTEKTSAIEAIDRLIGCTEFKELMHELKAVAPLTKKHATYDIFSYRCYLFSIDTGRGLTTALKLFAGLLQEEELFGISETVPLREIYLPAPDDLDGELAALVPELGRGHVVCLDISEWLGLLNSKTFRRFLARIEDFSTDNIVVFRVPFLEDQALAGIREALSQILTVRTVAFTPFTAEEFRSCASMAFADAGYTLADDAWEIFDLLIYREKADGVFYGINTVRKVVREMIYEKQVYDARCGKDDCRIERLALQRLYAAASYDMRGGEEMLNGLIGMETVKKRVYEILSQIELAKKQRLEMPCIHMRFVGNPGTGKTTVARALGKMLKERGLLRRGGFMEHSGRDFCGRYVGQTAPRTAEICRDAYGSVLFIDEAYSLYKGESASDSFGLEAIDTLITEMENHRDDLVVIMAGYPGEMETLMRANPGLRSRMPYCIEFPNYTREELAQIFLRFCEGKFDCEPDFAEAVYAYFLGLPDRMIRAENFSNARFVRNLFERTWGKASMRARLGGGEVRLCKEDLRLAGSDREFGEMLEKRSTRVGF